MIKNTRANLNTGSPLTEAQVLSICHAPPDDPSRGNGLTLRKIGRRGQSKTPSPRSDSPAVGSYGSEEDLLAPSMPMSTKATKRASSISILSGLGVPNPEKALEPAASTSMLTGSPTKTPASARRPSKLRNFFGQRPPSELITTHLPEYFPNADKKVLERTRRQSMMRAGVPYKRDSVVSWNAPAQSRFSVSTLGSQRGSARLSVASASPMLPDRTSLPPPLPDTKDRHLPPRLSLSTDDGSSIDLETDETYKRLSSPHILPPVAFPSESLAESLNLETSEPETRRQSRTLSTASKRMSYITELRSKRDRSDTASLMTVDEITASVESRRQSTLGTLRPDSGSDEWTQVDAEDDAEKRSIMEEEEEYEEEEEEEYEDEDDETVADEGALSDEEDETGKTTISAGRTCLILRPHVQKCLLTCLVSLR